jgi:PEP-CTERM motif-containing protein
VAGIDTVYALSTVEGLLRKFTFNGTSWAQNGSIAAAAAQDLTGVVNGTTVQLFVTSPTSLFSYTDATGIGGTLTGTLGAAIATAPANTAFRGVGVFPVPEPTSLVLVGIGAVALYCRRRPR